KTDATAAQVVEQRFVRLPAHPGEDDRTIAGKSRPAPGRWLEDMRLDGGGHEQISSAVPGALTRESRLSRAQAHRLDRERTPTTQRPGLCCRASNRCPIPGQTGPTRSIDE